MIRSAGGGRFARRLLLSLGVAAGGATCTACEAEPASPEAQVSSRSPMSDAGPSQGDSLGDADVPHESGSIEAEELNVGEDEADSNGAADAATGTDDGAIGLGEAGSHDDDAAPSPSSEGDEPPIPMEEVNGEFEGPGSYPKQPLIMPDGPSGGVCVAPEDLRLEQWQEECVPPTQVDVACEVTVTGTGSNGTQSDTLYLDDRGFSLYRRISASGEVALHILSDNWAPVLEESWTPEGCVYKRAETLQTSTGSIDVTSHAEGGSHCQVIEQSAEAYRRYDFNDCTCDAHPLLYEEVYDDQGRPQWMRSLIQDYYRWTYYEYEGDLLLRETDEAGDVLVSYEYDEQGREVRECDTNYCYVTEYFDDGSIKQSREGDPTFAHTTFTTDGLPLVVTIQDEGESEPISRRIYERNMDGWVLSETFEVSGGAGTTEYTYTPGGRLQSITTLVDGELRTLQEFRYDALGRFTGRYQHTANSPEQDCTTEVLYPSDDCSLALFPVDYTDDPGLYRPRYYDCPL